MLDTLAYDRPHLRSAGVSTGRKALALAALIAASACSGVEERPVDELLREGDLFLNPETMQPYSGLAIATFADRPSVVAQRLSIREGAYDGPFEAFFENQRLSSREFYAEGVKNGPYEWYFENGQLFEAGSYKDGLLDGPYRAYWETGELYEEGTYRAGRFEGPRRWYLDGRLIELVTYAHGVMEGLYERYEVDGTLVLKGVLASGQACGTWIEGEHTLVYPDCGSRVTE